MDKTDKAIAEILEKLTKLVEQHGDTAVSGATQLAIGVAQVDAVQTIIAGLAFLAVAATLCFVLTRWCRYAWRKHLQSSNPLRSDWDVAAIVSGVFGGAAVIALGVVGLLHLTNVWAWVGIFNPKLYLAHKILEKVL